MIDLKGKIVLVTGAGRGIGAAIVRQVVAAGGRAVLHDIRATGGAAELQQMLGAENCHVIAGDLAAGTVVPEVWRAAVAWQGRIDVLVNNAGIYEPADVDHDFEAWVQSWHRTLEINLVAPGHFCREAIRHFRERGGGIIINLASRAAFRGDDPDYMHYAASKAGVVAMTRTIARHFGRQNITAFAIAPGFVRTGLNAAFFKTHGEAAAERDIPLGAIAEPEDIANTVVFLASGLARHATGTTIDINGASYVR
jgi:NAD(P)-dependent dehydrogenase (short-subunit alcohol dehydrogenase family)